MILADTTMTNKLITIRRRRVNDPKARTFTVTVPVEKYEMLYVRVNGNSKAEKVAAAKVYIPGKKKNLHGTSKNKNCKPCTIDFGKTVYPSAAAMVYELGSRAYNNPDFRYIEKDGTFSKQKRGSAPQRLETSPTRK